MGDDSCILKLIEIVPVDDSRNCSDVKLSPCHVKVCIVFYILLCIDTWSRLALLNSSVFQYEAQSNQSKSRFGIWFT